MTLADGWDKYRAKVMSKAAGETQVKECRRAFYAGAESFFDTIYSALEAGPETTDVEVAKLAGMERELVEIAAKVVCGIA